MVRLVALLEPAQDGDGVLDGRLADEHLLEPPLQGGVLLDALAVLVERRRADQPQLAAGQHGLEHVARVHGALAARAGADDGVQLVDEGDDLAVGAGDLLEHGLEPLLELAAVLGAGDHRGQVERDQLLAAQRLGDVAGDDALGEPLDDGGLADAGLADEDRVVLGAPGQHLHDAADLGVAADDRVELAVAGGCGQVDAVLLERLVGALRAARESTVTPTAQRGMAASIAAASRPKSPVRARPSSRWSVETKCHPCDAIGDGRLQHGERARDSGRVGTDEPDTRRQAARIRRAAAHGAGDGGPRPRRAAPASSSSACSASALSRCAGSIWGCPCAAAARVAAARASWALVVSCRSMECGTS